MYRRFHSCARAACLLGLAVAVMLVSAGGRPLAHEGHDHPSEAPADSGVPASPRVVATSESYQFVGIVEGEVLVIYLDRAVDNAPVTTATIEVVIDGQPLKAELQERTATYEVTSALLRAPGGHEVVVALTEGNAHDLLVGTLAIPAKNSGHDHNGGLGAAIRNAIGNDGTGRAIVFGASCLLLAAVGVTILRRRKMLLVLPAAVVALVAAPVGRAHEGHDHGPDLTASAGNSPSRRPDGSIFLPKPSQRLLEVRTRIAAVETKFHTVQFNGHTVANPNRSGIVQSTIQGRYEPPERGVPPLGTLVKAGDLLGRVAPSFASIDSSDMAQTLGNLDQEIALARTKLARQEQLLQRNVVPRATVEDTRIQLDGLEKRRRELLAARVRPEELRAPVGGVIATGRVVAGQVVSQNDQIFQIVDPAHLLVEALVFDQIDPDAVSHATGSVGNVTIRLKFMGRSRALQQQYSILQFEVLEPRIALDVGAPMTVVAQTAAQVTGILMPRAALAQAANGQTVVFAHKEPEVFVPRPVRVQPFDSEHVLITGGLAAGEKVVVQNAPLINQVR